jgi:hypothetical protein
MMEFYGGKQAGITVIFYSDINAEGVRQFQGSSGQREPWDRIIE